MKRAREMKERGEIKKKKQRRGEERRKVVKKGRNTGGKKGAERDGGREGRS